jgi:carboxyl-terminal processing protease
MSGLHAQIAFLKEIHRLWLLLLGSVLVLVVSDCCRANEPESVLREELTPKQRLEVFDFVWRTVRDSHYDPKMNGIGWNAVRRRYEPRVREASSDAEFYRLLNEMVGELKQSHTGVIPPSWLRVNRGANGQAQEDEGALGTGEVGITAQLVEESVLVVRVRDDSPAAKADIRPGDQLLAIDDTPLDKPTEMLKTVSFPFVNRPQSPAERRFMVYYMVSRLLSGAPNSTVRLRYRTLGGEEREVTLTRTEAQGVPQSLGWLPPVSVQVESRRLEGNIGYVAFNYFMPAVMEPVRKAIRQMHDARALIIDLRGNMGGIGLMAGGIGGLLTTKELPMGVMRFREGNIPIVAYPQPGAYTGPVVILIDEATVSTAEIMAGALQEARRAILVGRPTPGYALPSKIERLPYGGYLQCVTADYRTPKGRQLEGVGVKPNHEVQLTRDAFRRSPDPVLQAAIDIINSRR